MDVKDLYFFDHDSMAQLAEERKVSYAEAKPFPFAVIDNFLPLSMADELVKEFPSTDFSGLQRPDNAFQKMKRGRAQENHFKGISPIIRHALNEFNSMAMIEFLEKLTGINGLIPDPSYTGGAIHQILPQGSLAVHADFNWDYKRSLVRRVNVLYYLNKDWNDDYGGHLEIWDQEMKECMHRVLPIFNRCVIFSTSENSYHGHPIPLSCPEGRSRNSLAFYYYTSPGGGEQLKKFSTLWQKRPGTQDLEGEGGVVKTSVP